MWQAKDPQMGVMNSDIFAASRSLHNSTIPQFAKRLWDNPEWAATRFLPLNIKTAGMRLAEALIVLKRWRKSELVREVHRSGINARHIGRVRHHFRLCMATGGPDAIPDMREKALFNLQATQLQMAPQIDSLLLIELVIRVVKTKARKRQRRSMQRLKLPSEVRPTQT